MASYYIELLREQTGDCSNYQISLPSTPVAHLPG